VLHLMGIDHTRLTYRFPGPTTSGLTDVSGRSDREAAGLLRPAAAALDEAAVASRARRANEGDPDAQSNPPRTLRSIERPGGLGRSALT
jgi:hypothetical protein